MVCARSVSSLDERFPWLSPKITLMMVLRLSTVQVVQAFTVENKVNLLSEAIRSHADVLAICHDGKHDEILVVDDPGKAMEEIWSPGMGSRI